MQRCLQGEKIVASWWLTTLEDTKRKKNFPSDMQNLLTILCRYTEINNPRDFMGSIQCPKVTFKWSGKLSIIQTFWSTRGTKTKFFYISKMNWTTFAKDLKSTVILLGSPEKNRQNRFIRKRFIFYSIFFFFCLYICKYVLYIILYHASFWDILQLEIADVLVGSGLALANYSYTQSLYPMYCATFKWILG